MEHPSLIKNLFLTSLFLLVGWGSHAQYETNLTVRLNDFAKELDIKQEFNYYNDSNYNLGILYFNDWAHAYSNKNTGLAKRFAQEFKKSLHLAKENERGYTTIISAVDGEYEGLEWERTEEDDIIKFRLNKPLSPGESVKLIITYKVKLPPNKFTDYGYDNRGNYYLKDWYLTPAVYDGKWHLYSNKNLEDLYTNITKTTIDFTYPKGVFLNSNFKENKKTEMSNSQRAELVAEDQKGAEIILTVQNLFTTHVTPQMKVVTNISAPRYDPIGQGISINRITDFIERNLGKYPHEKLLVSEMDYNKDPLYGINQLPSFIRPYEQQFQFEMKFLKTALNSILRETMFLDPRKEQWLNSAIANYLMIGYVEEFYPHRTLLGNLSRIWGIRSFNLAKMGFNEQYPFLYNLTARKNLDQALTTPNDSLIKFNRENCK
ncbi:hypothetical protein NYZ99_08280 [Maribacter litopenaei]|uniref:Metalloprotease n=1 Tax=Maribacter litopenaei TaxID=2976127 RepID=A0ABY5YBI4_9FLAO|nr:hypothetical protein [Maribacter litopenaei]UWX56223.1 hypothetical protein NYZ99_08280 [Maribacter litopenaei]